MKIDFIFFKEFFEEIRFCDCMYICFDNILIFVNSRLYCSL